MNRRVAITNEKRLISNSLVQIVKRPIMIGAVTLIITAPAISQNSELQQVQMASLPDGTSYESQTVLNAAAKQLVVTTTNSDYQKLGAH